MPIENVVALFERSSSTLHFDDGTSFTATELVDDGRRLATYLRVEGLESGDRIAIHRHNDADYVRLLLACAAGGYLAVSVNTRYSPGEVDDLIARSGARRFAGGAWHGHAPAGDLGGADDPFVVFTTSGTTSRPKMVLHAQRSIAEHAADAAAMFGYSATDTVLAVMPFCGTFGLASLTAAVAGDCVVVVTNFDVARTADLIARHAVTAVNGSDDMFHRLLEHGAELGSIRLGGYARFNSSLDDVVARAESAGATLTGLYGMSEVQALFSLRDPTLDAGGRRRAGGTMVSPRAAYRVVDGELQLRGPSLMLGYLAEGGALVDEALTAEHLADGWFRTGDLAVEEDDRTFEYLTRGGDAMRLGGFLVSPTEIEAVITDLPGVSQAQVVSVDRPGGARPIAFVIGDVEESTVIARCRDRLARHKVPVRVVRVEEFPTTPSANGTKIQRGRLRELAERILAGEPSAPGTSPHSTESGPSVP
jgi:fatty-acyl-CoA synthase